MHGSLEDHFLVIRIPGLNKVITYLLVSKAEDALSVAVKKLKLS